jgi:hypothetical protein
MGARRMGLAPFLLCPLLQNLARLIELPGPQFHAHAQHVLAGPLLAQGARLQA